MKFIYLVMNLQTMDTITDCIEEESQKWAFLRVVCDSGDCVNENAAISIVCGNSKLQIVQF